MALPKLTAPTYELDLPSTGRKIKFRPFLVKEQKLLMIAEESKDENQIAETIQQLINSCTYGKVDALISPIFDIEYVFLQLRMRSVGGNVTLTITCPDDNKTETTIKINLEDVNVLNDEKHTNIIKITDNVKNDITKKELNEFIDSFNTNQLEKLMEFFNTMPKIRHIVNVTNPKTKVISEVTLEGMDTFLV